MQSLDVGRIEARIESICQKGCRRVRHDILILESGAELPETQGLTPSERRSLLNELKEIMSVYGDSCRID